MTQVRDLLWIGGGRVVTALIALISLRLATTILPPEQYGILAILFTFQVFSGLFLVNPVGQYINRHTHAWADEGILLQRLRPYRHWIYFSASIGAIACGVWTLTQTMVLVDRIQIMVMVWIIVNAATWNATYVGLLNMLGFRAQSVIWSAITALTGLGSSWLFVSISESGLYWFAGQALGLAIGAIGAGYTVKGHLPAPKKERIPLLGSRDLRRYVLPLAVATGFMWWLLSGYRLLIEAYWGLSALGYIFVGLAIASQLWGVVEALSMQFLFPLFYRRISLKDSSESALAYSDLLNILCPIYLVLAAAMIVGAPSLLVLLVDKAYFSAYPFVIVGIVVECSRALVNVFATAAQIDRKMAALIPGYALGAISVTVGISIVFRLDGSVSLALVALPLAGFVTLAVSVFSMSQLIVFKLDIFRWMAAGFVLIVSIALSWQIFLMPSHIMYAFISLSVIAIIAIGLLFLLNFRSLALKRVLAVKLKN